MPKILVFKRVILPAKGMIEGEPYCARCMCHGDECMCNKPLIEEIEVSQEEYNCLMSEQRHD